MRHNLISVIAAMMVLVAVTIAWTIFASLAFLLSKLW